jgi:hypothetical protein
VRKFRILRNVEHDEVLYVPSGTNNPPSKAISVGRGIHISVNATGIIELPMKQAKPLLECGSIRELLEMEGEMSAAGRGFGSVDQKNV